MPQGRHGSGAAGRQRQGQEDPLSAGCCGVLLLSGLCWLQGPSWELAM